MRFTRHLCTVAILALYVAQIVGGRSMHLWQCSAGSRSCCCDHSHHHHSENAGGEQHERDSDGGNRKHDPSTCRVDQAEISRKAEANAMNVASWGKASACLSTLSLLLLAGCSAEDPRIVALRNRLLLLAEPAAATTIAEAKAAVIEKPDVLFVARVAADEHEAFVPGQASFLVTEILPDEHGHGGKDHTDNCPFCKRKAAEGPRAAVQFLDAAGETLDIDGRKLFCINPGDTVVIRGTGELMPDLDLFVVTADGIYVRQSEVGH